MKAVLAHIDAGRLSLDGLVTHRHDAADAAQAYRRAFEDTDCLKMVLDWRHAA
jgi:3-hydroxyethyl bacteriochlorophyllide a dehydrogenase